MTTPYKPCLLTNRTILKASGKDAPKLLQSLLSCNIEQLNAHALTYGFLLTPQGRFLHEFFVFKHDGDVYLDTQADAVDALLKRLKMYTLKRDATFEVVSDWSVLACHQPASNDDTLTFTDPRHEALGLRCYGHTSALAPLAEEPSMERYNAYRVSFGIPSAEDFVSEKTLLLDYDVDQLHGIDFEKGCYVGQEVTARMHYRAVDKKGLYIITQQDDSHPLPAPSSEMMLNDQKAGTMLSVVGGQGIAILRHEHVDGILIANDGLITVTRPSWAHKDTV